MSVHVHHFHQDNMLVMLTSSTAATRAFSTVYVGPCTSAPGDTGKLAVTAWGYGLQPCLVSIPCYLHCIEQLCGIMSGPTRLDRQVTTTRDRPLWKPSISSCRSCAPAVRTPKAERSRRKPTARSSRQRHQPPAAQAPPSAKTQSPATQPSQAARVASPAQTTKVAPLASACMRASVVFLHRMKVSRYLLMCKTMPVSEQSEGDDLVSRSRASRRVFDTRRCACSVCQIVLKMH